MIALIKNNVPSYARRYDRADKSWLIEPEFVARLAQATGNQAPVDLLLREDKMQLLAVRYIGRAKDRGGDHAAAFGHDGYSWKFVFPLQALRWWFEVGDDDGHLPAIAGSLYGVLRLPSTATGNEIRAAHRRGALQWHPDRNAAPGAREQFEAVQTAYEILSDTARRVRYDAARAFLATAGQRESTGDGATWCPPRQTGLVLAMGHRTVAGFVLVSRIRAWGDIVNHDGRVLVSYWPAGADIYKERWV